MDEGLRLIDVLVVVLDYLGWWDYSILQMKVELVKWSIDVLHYTPIVW